MVPELAKLCAETPQSSLQRELQLAGLQCLTTLSMHDRVKAPLAVRGKFDRPENTTALYRVHGVNMPINSPLAALSIACNTLAPTQPH